MSRRDEQLRAWRADRASAFVDAEKRRHQRKERACSRKIARENMFLFSESVEKAFRETSWVAGLLATWEKANWGRDVTLAPLDLIEAAASTGGGTELKSKVAAFIADFADSENVGVNIRGLYAGRLAAWQV